MAVFSGRVRPVALRGPAVLRRPAVPVRPADAALRLPDGRKLLWHPPPHNPGVSPGKRCPRHWRSLSLALSGGEHVEQKRLNGWLLVLEAKKIPHVLVSGGTSPRLYLPALYEGVAAHEILAFERERPFPEHAPPTRDNAFGVLCVLALLVLWHGMRFGWFVFELPAPPFPSTPGEWNAAFALDVYKLRVPHEYWRAVTALTLHADGAHLVGNMLFGLFFFIPLCRRAGLGLGMALALAAGVCGNLGNALTRNDYATSLGFSTALFGAVGSLCALTAADIGAQYLRFSQTSGAPGSAGKSFSAELAVLVLRRVALPLAAGLALLGMLGGGGEARTDYAAHIWGFACGVLCTFAALSGVRALFALDPVRQKLVQALLLLASLGLVAAAWGYALEREALLSSIL